MQQCFAEEELALHTNIFLFFLVFPNVNMVASLCAKLSCPSSVSSVTGFTKIWDFSFDSFPWHLSCFLHVRINAKGRRAENLLWGRSQVWRWEPLSGRTLAQLSSLRQHCRFLIRPSHWADVRTQLQQCNEDAAHLRGQLQVKDDRISELQKKLEERNREYERLRGSYNGTFDTWGGLLTQE